MPLLRLLATQAANLLDYRRISRDLAISDKTVKAYVKLLSDVFLVHVLRPWRPGLGPGRSMPKPLIVDSGLLAYLLGADETRIAEDDQVTGKIFESFCGMEIVKHAAWSEAQPDIYHYRDGRDEIDLVVEARSGDCLPRDEGGRLRGSQRLRRHGEAPGPHRRSLQLWRSDHTGARTVPLGDRIWAVPVSGLWTD